MAKIFFFLTLNHDTINNFDDSVEISGLGHVFALVQRQTGTLNAAKPRASRSQNAEHVNQNL